MKVICDRGALLSAVNLVGSVVAARTPKPELLCIKLAAKKVGSKGGAGLLTLSATDAEISIRLSIAQVDVHQEGETLVPADKIRQIVSAEEQEPTLTLESDGDVCHIKGQDAKFKVFCSPVANFPPIPEFPEKSTTAATFAINADTLRQLIERTAFSTARETSRYAINGVLLNRVGKKIEMVATDGRRLALARGSAESAGGGDDSRSCIIPTKALLLLARTINDPEGTVRVAITENQALFLMSDSDSPAPGAGTVLASNLVEGSFPPYEEVIPKDQDKRATFDVDKLSSAVKRAALLTNEESRGVRMAFNSGKDSKLRLSSRAPEMGEAEIDVGMEAYEGGDIEIGFNPAFLTDALKVVSEAQVILELKAPNKPGLLKSGNDFLYVVMPVSLT